MIVELMNSLRKWRDDRRAIKALALLDDDRLNDIGITRGNLASAVRHGLRR